MTRFSILKVSFLAVLGLIAAAGESHAQYTPGFQFYNTRITPRGGLATVAESYEPYWGGTQSYQSNYVNPWLGVSFGKRAISNSYGTTVVTQGYNPWIGPTYTYQYAPAPIVNPQMSFYYGRPVVYNNQMAFYNHGRYHPGFYWGHR
ncbi:MAG: hypothetical protein U0798_15865 [Gemmataceae bacterium]